MNADVSWHRAAMLSLLLLVSALAPAFAEGGVKTSRTIRSVLREPLPPEELTLSESAAELVISGPTFTTNPLKIEVLCSPNGANGLPESPVPAATSRYSRAAR